MRVIADLFLFLRTFFLPRASLAAENLALRVLIEQMDQVLRQPKRGYRARIRQLYKLVRIAKEVGQ